MMKRQDGFTLIELIACIVIMGFIAVGLTMLISFGMGSFFNARNVDNAGMSAQLALERISIELRDANGGPGTGGAIRVVPAGTSIEYTTTQTALAGTRTLAYSGGTITLTPTSGGTAYQLLTGISSCSMGYSGTGRASTLRVTFTLTNAPKNEVFSITVKPRANTLTPSTS